MLTVDIGKLPFLSEDKGRIDKLNELLRRNKNLMPHQVASGTGLSLQESMTLLVFFFYLNYGKFYILVYHRDFPNEPTSAINIFDGFPEMPFYCEVCDKIVEDEDELLYDYMFVKNSDFEVLAGNQ